MPVFAVLVPLIIVCTVSLLGSCAIWGRLCAVSRQKEDLKERCQTLSDEVDRKEQAMERERQSFSTRLDTQAQSFAVLNQELVLARAEVREQSEKSRASTALAYAQHVEKMQLQMNEVLKLSQQQAESSRRSTDVHLQNLSGNLGSQLQAHNKVILSVSEQLGALGEAAKRMQALGHDISSLQEILQAPKLRGNLGELLLGEILRQVLPADAFSLQYRMPGDTAGSEVIVDAIIKMGDRLVPIDSKFPLESFKRLLGSQVDEVSEQKQRKAFLEVVRGHIDAIAQKYIRPEAGTYDFALAYLPAENVYYEAVVRQSQETQSIVSYAAARNVVPVSPSTLYAYLLTVAYGLKGLRIENQAEAIRGQLEGFHKKFGLFYQSLEKTNKHIQNAAKTHDDAMQRAGKLNDQVGKITGAALELENKKEGEVLRLSASSEN